MDDKAASLDGAGEKSPLPRVLGSMGAGAQALKAFPSITYPTIYGATTAERAQILGTLDSLPLHQASGVRSVVMVPEIPTQRENWVVLGRATDLNVSNRIQLSRTQLTSADRMHRTLVHEVGHTVDYDTQTLKLFSERSSKEPFGAEPFVSDYAKTNHREDFAESYEEFHLDRERLKETAPSKYEALRELDEPSLLQRLVDRKEFRETGKAMSEAFGGSELSRHLAQGAFFASSLLQAAHGVSQWVGSGPNEDPMGHVSGVLNTASGLAFASGASPLLGVSLQGANQALQSAVKRGVLGAPEVESTVTLPVRPLEKLFGRDAADLQDGHRPGKVLAVAAGGALGGSVGSFVGPYLGVLGGYHLAGGLGGAVGLVAGGVAGFWVGSQAGGRVAAKLVGLEPKTA